MSEKQKEFMDNLGWISSVLKLPDRITRAEFEEKVNTVFRSGELSVIKWCGLVFGVPEYPNHAPIPWASATNFHFPTNVKTFIVPNSDVFSPRYLPTAEELGILCFPSRRGCYWGHTNPTDKASLFRIYGLIIPDIRDLERLMFDEDEDILIAINGLPLADQLKQEVLKARECMKNNLSIAVIATLANLRWKQHVKSHYKPTKKHTILTKMA